MKNLIGREQSIDNYSLKPEFQPPPPLTSLGRETSEGTGR